MLQLLFSKKKIIKPYVIAEIGNNHKGSLDLAKQMFYSAKECGASAVKLQKRCNKKLYTSSLFDQPYINANSFGKTYGEHREKLEFEKREYLILKKLAKKLNLDFLCTPFDFESVDFLEEIKIDGYKIASADLINIPLQKYIALKRKPIFMSIGGGDYQDIDRAYKNITRYNKKIVILHCTASYPADIKDMNLEVIKVLKKKYNKNIIGLSDHENGIDAASIAFMMGARVFEKHFTLDRSWKGTDQSFSLEPQGLSKMIRNLNRIPLMIGSAKKKLLKCEIEPLKKMQKSIVSSKNLKKGIKIKKEDLDLKSPGGGFKPYEISKLIGKVLRFDLKKDQILNKKHIK